MPEVLMSDGFIQGIAGIVAEDTSKLATASHAPKICPILNNISPNAQTLASDLVLSNDTLTGVSGVVGGQLYGWDPVSQKWYVEVAPPAGGFNFSVSAPPDADFFVYGWACTYGAGNTLGFLELFDEPVKFFAGNDAQTLALDPIRFFVDSTGIA